MLILNNLSKKGQATVPFLLQMIYVCDRIYPDAELNGGESYEKSFKFDFSIDYALNVAC